MNALAFLPLVASADGAQLYVGVGSNSNAAENGMEVEQVWRVTAARDLSARVPGQ